MGPQTLIRKFGVLFAFVAIFGGVFMMLRSGNNAGKPTLRLYVWSTYFSEDVIKKFTARTGVKVELSYLSSNEEMFAKLRAGATGFDIIQPSDYMIRQLNNLKMLRELDKSQLPNLSQLEPAYQNPPYDPGGRFSVPFTFGTTGIAINTDKVKIPAGGVDWSMLTKSPDPKHTSVLDDMREVFGAVLKSQGNSLNATDLASLEKARSQIGLLKNSILMFNSEPKALLLKGEINIAHIFSCDAAQTIAANPKIKYYIPKEGGTLWTDNFAIPATAVHVKEAHQFINFVLEPDIALEIVREKKLATPNIAAREKLTPEERGDRTVYPDAKELQKMQYLEDIGDSLQTVSRMWTELKS